MLSDIASVATAVGVLAAVVQLVMSRFQSRSVFEQDFVARYWELDDALLVDNLGEVPASDHVYWRRYLRLCEDEIESMRLGQISWRTWEVWHDAIWDRAAGTRAALAHADHNQFEWLRKCLDRGRHSGARCRSVFAPGSQVHSKHISARWTWSASLRWFLIANAARRRAFARQVRHWDSSRDSSS